MDNDLEKLIDERIKKVVPQYLQGSAFLDSKYTDTPTDANQVVPRGYVTMNGATANRPIASVVGQRYFDTDLGKPVYWSGTTFVDSSGAPA